MQTVDFTGELNFLNGWREAVKNLVLVDGYVIAGVQQKLNIGDILIDDFGEWFITEEGTYEEAVAQVKANAEFLKLDLQAIEPPPQSWFFYKTIPKGKRSLNSQAPLSILSILPFSKSRTDIDGNV